MSIIGLMFIIIGLLLFRGGPRLLFCLAGLIWILGSLH